MTYILYKWINNKGKRLRLQYSEWVINQLLDDSNEETGMAEEELIYLQTRIVLSFTQSSRLFAAVAIHHLVCMGQKMLTLARKQGQGSRHALAYTKLGYHWSMCHQDDHDWCGTQFCLHVRNNSSICSNDGLVALTKSTRLNEVPVSLA